jgi:acetyltransferase-like isoleucine patch superfamily enzyme
MKRIKRIFSNLYFSILMVLPEEFSRFRISFYNSRENCLINKACYISPNVRIKGRFEMGKGSSIAQNCTISGEEAGVFIGENVMIAPNVVIVAFSHGYDIIETPMAFQKYVEGSIFIENNVWIASNCTIAKNVRIGEGSIISANSFVNKDVLPYSIVGGVPAKMIKSRI